MTQELSRKRVTLTDRIPALNVKAPWHRLGLSAILLLSAFLNLFRLTNEGYGNTYYAAAVKDMLTSWHNFFFASFDAGFVTVDKPPLGFWFQALSTRLFGFHDWSLMLPQTLAGVLCVALLYPLVGVDRDGRVHSQRYHPPFSAPSPIGASLPLASSSSSWIARRAGSLEKG